MMSKNIRVVSVAAIVIALALFSTADAQVGTAGNGGTGDVGTGDFGTGNFGGGGGGNPFGGGGAFGNQFSLEDFSFNDVEVEPDQRFERGFIGRTAADATDGIDNRSSGFVGRRGSSTGGGELGGGVNGGGNNAFGNAGRGQGGFNGVNGSQNYFEAFKLTPVRARLRSGIGRVNFSAPVVANRFQNRLSTMPSTRSYSGGVNIAINNRTATLTGVVRDPNVARRLVRQLRMEPGVYKIIDNIQVQ